MIEYWAIDTLLSVCQAEIVYLKMTGVECKFNLIMSRILRIEFFL